MNSVELYNSNLKIQQKGEAHKNSWQAKNFSKDKQEKLSEAVRRRNEVHIWKQNVTELTYCTGGQS